MAKYRENLKWVSQWRSQEEVAPIAVNGLLAGKKVIVPGKINKLILFMNKLLPLSLKMVLLKKIGISFLPKESLEDERFKNQA